MQTNLNPAFTGSEIEVILLKGELEENGISCYTRDGVTFWQPGFYFGAPASIDLYIAESDLDQATPIIQEFIQNQQSEK